MMTRCLFAAASTILLSTALPASAGSVRIDDFAGVGAWSPNRDGGAVTISEGAVDGPHGERTMRLRFEGGEHQWGNALRTTSLPPNAVGVEFDLRVAHAEPASAMYLWLLEKDGDGWASAVSFEGKRMYDLGGGWVHCFVPLASLNYEPRGNKAKELLSVDRMMLGLNYANSDVHVANLAFRTSGDGVKPGSGRTPDLQVKRGERGSVAILRDEFEKLSADADPAALGAVLSSAGFGVTFLKAGDLADASVLTRASFDCLVLPYGSRYPQAAADTIKAYLKSGGSFLSMGGYAFDQACTPDESGKLVPGDAVVTAQDIANGVTTARWMNTRNGVYGDTLGLQPDQIGVFDPCYHLNWVSEIRGTGSQSAVPAALHSLTKVEGYAACSMLGSDSPVFPEKWGRHIPLVKAYDSLGRYRGDVGSIAFNYAGPYTRSSWAFFGVTNENLFADQSPMLRQLPEIMGALTRKSFLHSFSTDLACYKDGEPVKLSCKVADLGPRDLQVSVRFMVFDRSGRTVFISAPTSVAMKAGSTEPVSAQFQPKDFASDLCRVTAELTVDGKVIDSMETGFAVYDSKVTAGGFKLKFKGNYFHDGDRTVFISGTNHTGAIFFSGNENPLVWDRDLARMNENGLNTLRVLHFSPFLSKTPSSNSVQPLDLKIDRMPLAIERQLDALVQLCQKHKIVLFLSIHDWMRQDLSDEELAAQRHFAELIAVRYKDSPGFMIDIQNEPYIEYRPAAKGDEFPHIVRSWNDYLRQRYGADEALKAAWKLSPPDAAIGSIPYHTGTDEWSDIRSRDAEEFRSLLGLKWVEENEAGARKGNPKGTVSVGFLPEYWALNKILCIDKLDFANFHTYSPIDMVRSDIKLFDRRFQGKSVSIGEFGSLADHDKRNHGQDSATQDYNWFLLVGHYLFGMGGSFMENWDWKEMDDCVFPWGINYPCGGPSKTILDAYRNQSLLFRELRPVYQPQEVFLVIPLDQMLGGKKDMLTRALFSFSDTMLEAHADYGVIDDRHLDQLPASAKTLVYPFPFSIPDKAYGQLKAFVERGGRLCVTGDLSYDALRQRTKTDRLKELCGVSFVSESYPDVARLNEKTPCIAVEQAGAQRSGDVYVNSLGKGKVYFTPVPNPGGSAQALVEPLRAIGPGAWIDCTAPHVFRLPLSDGGRVYVMVNPTRDEHKSALRDAGIAPTEIVLGANGVGLLRFGKDGKLLAVESHGPVNVGGRTILNMTGRFAVISCDGNDLASSREMIVLPFGGGELKPARTGMNDLVTQTGDIVDGTWHTLSESKSGTISASDETAFDIRIIAPKDRIEHLSRFVASELMLR